MYKTIVAHQVRKAFAALSAGNTAAVTKGLAEDAVYEFVGDHALGGRRHGRALIETWFARVDRLMGGGRFEVRDVLVKGWPWRTRVISVVDIAAEVAGEPYRNRMLQILDIRWGRIVAIYSLEDTQLLAGALHRLAETGVAEAAAAPIVG